LYIASAVQRRSHTLGRQSLRVAFELVKEARCRLVDHEAAGASIELGQLLENRRDRAARIFLLHLVEQRQVYLQRINHGHVHSSLDLPHDVTSRLGAPAVGSD
jgi:hypothetical protein